MVAKISSRLEKKVMDKEVFDAEALLLQLMVSDYSNEIENLKIGQEISIIFRDSIHNIQKIYKGILTKTPLENGGYKYIRYDENKKPRAIFYHNKMGRLHNLSGLAYIGLDYTSEGKELKITDALYIIDSKDFGKYNKGRITEKEFNKISRKLNNIRDINNMNKRILGRTLPMKSLNN